MGELKWVLTNRHNGDSITLSKDPKGWEEVQLVHERDTKYKGIFYEFALQVGFHCKGGGKEFVDAEYDDYGSEGDILVQLSVKCNGVFTPIFTGTIDFSVYRQEYKGNVLYTFVDLVKSGITQVIRNREDTEVNLLAIESLGGVALNSYTYGDYDLHLHSKTIKHTADLDGDDQTNCNRVFDPAAVISGVNLLPNFTAITAGYTETNNITDSIFLGSALNSGFPFLISTVGLDVTFPIDVTITYNFSGNFSVRHRQMADPAACGSNSTIVVQLSSFLSNTILRLYIGQDLATATTYDLVTIPSSGDNVATFKAYDFSNANTITTQFEPGDKVWLFWITDFRWDAPANADTVWIVDYNTADFTATALTNYLESNCAAIAIHEAWSRVCEQITDQTLAFKSEFFGRTNSQGLAYSSNGCAGFTALTSGTNIRLLNYDRNPITTSLIEMFESCNAIWGIGLGVEEHEGTEVVRAEELAYFFDNTVVFSAANPPAVQMTFATDECFNEIQIGFERWETEAANGIDEPLTKASYVFAGIKQLKNSLSLLCKYIASMYAIELTRRQIPKQTEDYKYDTNVFIIALKRDVTQLNIAEKNENFVSVTNLVAPSTAYNLRFNLFSIFDRLMNIFSTGLTKQNPQTIKNTVYEGNNTMAFQYVADGCPGDIKGTAQTNIVSEVQYTTGDTTRFRNNDPIFLPEIYSFSYAVPFDDYLLIRANPKGLIEFSHDGDVKKGYIRKLTYHLKKKMADFELIRKFE